MFSKIGLLIVTLSLNLAACKTTQNGEAAGLSDVAGVSTQPLVASWTQLGPNGQLIAKAISSDTSCPSMTVDGVTLPLQPRTPPSADFQILVCEAIVPANAQLALLNNQQLPLPKANPQRIIIFGDTGCRMKTVKNNKFEFQGCDTVHWPLGQLATLMASMKPDLVIHVGDFHYREAPCPGINPLCTRDIAGDNWTSWQQDFITPVTPLFSASPLLLVRGNHELCARGGGGWFHLLDPRPMPASCIDETSPYWVPVGDHQFGIMDSATDANHQPSLDQLAQTSIDNTLIWLFTHRPFLTPGADDETTVPPPTLPAAFAGVGKVGAVLTGHQHRLSFNTFDDSRPPELISGNGGTALDNEIVAGQTYSPVNGNSFHAMEWFEFGFLVFDRQAGGWAVSEYDRKGNVVFKCNMQEALGQRTNFSCSRTP